MSFLCKDCWIAHEPKTLLARCKVCDANTRVRRLDPLLGRAAPVSASARPSDVEYVCKLHPTEPLDLFCTRCKRQLSPRAVLDDRSIVAVIGDTGSGKTSLLWVLSEYLRSAPDLPVKIRQAFGDTDDDLEETVRELTGFGRGRATADTDAVVRNYAWELVTTTEWPARSCIVAFHDAAGEVWNDLATLSRENYDRLYRYLAMVGGVIFIIDGERLAEHINALQAHHTLPPKARLAEANEIAIVDAVSRRMRARTQPIPIAVAVSKADIFWDEPQWRIFRGDAHASPDDIDHATRELLASGGRRALVSAIAETFAPVRYFAISAFGRTVTPGAPVTLDSISPTRVHEPLLALIGMETRVSE